MNINFAVAIPFPFLHDVDVVFLSIGEASDEITLAVSSVYCPS